MDCNDDEEMGERKSKTAGGFTGRGVTLQMLLEDNILTPKEGAMSLEYMGQKFNGDLLADGKIFSAEVQEVFSSPSAWALRCKKIVNPEQKYGCGWSAVRYCGRPLDVYKNQWMKKRRLEQVSDSVTTEDCSISTNDPLPIEPELEIDSSMKSNLSDRQVFKHESLGNRASIEDLNLLVETISFATAGKLQPFLVSLNTAALVVMDVHCSLTSSEVVGYLGGLWDMNTNTLTIKQAFPCLSRLADGRSGQTTEVKIAQSMESSGLSLVGWYHSHPMAPPTPTVQDIDTQLEYQLRLKGTGEQGYRPCVAMISSLFQRMESSQTASPCHLMCYWVSPPPESRPLELGRPMAMQYNVVYDTSVKDEVIPKLVRMIENIESSVLLRCRSEPLYSTSWKYLRKIFSPNFNRSDELIIRGILHWIQKLKIQIVILSVRHCFPGLGIVEKNQEFFIQSSGF
uniref:EOG090X020Z n=1 Tax=Megafenestra aurita TaxID=2291010 RepID=A0A4Y7NGC3_9CRUS|nr:EOG090X020Z [Megafenestra aurita]SVE92250.1 EOG090X020Z [Megafenestra aurita]